MRRKVSFFAAVAIAVVFSACGANSRPNLAVTANRTTASHSTILPEAIPHGQELESGSTFMISEGNNHAMFPAGSHYARTANGIVVTYNGKTRTFSSSARVDLGTYHRYAPQPAN
jgi:hypothetical protein